MRAALALVALGVVFAATGVAADDLSYVSDEELIEELVARDGDIERTSRRIAALDLEELELAVALDEARTQVSEIDQRLVVRVALLYRLSRHGAALRYLISAGSATELLRRVKTLRRLVIDGLDDRRRAGLRVTELEGRMQALRDDQRRATEMLGQLEAARRELLNEQSQRAHRRASSRAR